MKICLIKIVQTLLVAGIVIGIANTAHTQSLITILVEDDCPYSCRPEKEMGLEGFVQEILDEVFNRNGYKTRFKMVPWLRALSMFNKKTPGIDGMIGMKNHPIDKEIALYPQEEIARYVHRFYVRKDSGLIDSWHYQGVQSLENLKIGAVKGWSYCDKHITQYIADGSPPYVQALYGEAVHERNYKKLISGRIDLWVANINNTEYLLSKKRKAVNKDLDTVIGFINLPVTNEVNAYPVFYKNQNGERYADIFTHGIRKLRKSGELNTIMAKYGLSDWKE